MFPIIPQLYTLQTFRYCFQWVVAWNSIDSSLHQLSNQIYLTIHNNFVAFTTFKLHPSFCFKFHSIDLFSKASTCAGKLSSGSYLVRLLSDLLLIIIFSFLRHRPCSSSNFVDPCHLLVVFFQCLCSLFV